MIYRCLLTVGLIVMSLRHLLVVQQFTHQPKLRTVGWDDRRD